MQQQHHYSAGTTASLIEFQLGESRCNCSEWKRRKFLLAETIDENSAHTFQKLILPFEKSNSEEPSSAHRHQSTVLFKHKLVISPSSCTCIEILVNCLTTVNLRCVLFNLAKVNGKIYTMQLDQSHTDSARTNEVQSTQHETTRDLSKDFPDEDKNIYPTMTIITNNLKANMNFSNKEPTVIHGNSNHLSENETNRCC